MPHHERPVRQPRDRYIVAPTLIFKICSYSPLSPLGSMLLNFLIEGSIAFTGGESQARKWVSFSVSEFAEERGYYRDRGYKALKELLGIGLIESQDSVLRTRGGVQKSLKFRIVSNEKLETLFEVLSTPKMIKGVSPKDTPLVLKKYEGVSPEDTPCIFKRYTLYLQRIHLVSSEDTPWGVSPLKSLKKKIPNYLLINFNYFLNKLNEFEGSFLELYSATEKTKIGQFRVRTKMNALVDRYSLFSTYMSMIVTLFEETPNIADFERLNRFIENNKEKIENEEQKIIAQSINLFIQLLELHNSIEVKDLESFHKTFRQNASVLLMQMKLDESSIIFFYEGIEDEFIKKFVECNFNQERFLKSVDELFRLYFKQKIFGIYGLSVA